MERVENRKFVCFHGHFYQPPRENPWTGEIECQESAAPFHDWNERIVAESYLPNARARILGPAGEVLKVVSNYGRISFDFGPTLLRYLEKAEPELYASILAADRAGRQRFGGHGGAIAQAYHHSILPLANRRDKRTEILWGLRDFEHRFGRKSEGIWLPETAVDLEVLEMLADQGVEFTVLSPYQAARVRGPRESCWRDVGDGSVDTRRAYRIQLPSGRDLALFFYNGEISQSIAFRGLLHSGDALIRELMCSLTGEDGAELAHVATDGETYGHHHQFGEMALAYALDRLGEQSEMRLTVYGQFLQESPPRWEVEIRNGTAWSCAHGVERWRSDCGCHTGGGPAWSQKWRTPLRRSLDWLRDQVAPLYEREAGRYLKEPWAARDGYVELILEPRRRRAYLADWSRRPLSRQEEERVLQLLELQRNSLMMYTSCGWFFSDVSGIETVQILRYAARVIELAEQLFGKDLESAFLNRLSRARSNISEERNGRQVFRRRVISGAEPWKVDSTSMWSERRA